MAVGGQLVSLRGWRRGEPLWVSMLGVNGFFRKGRVGLADAMHGGRVVREAGIMSPLQSRRDVLTGLRAPARSFPAFQVSAQQVGTASVWRRSTSSGLRTQQVDDGMLRVKDGYWKDILSAEVSRHSADSLMAALSSTGEGAEPACG